MTGIWIVDVTVPTVPTILSIYLEDNLLHIMVQDSYLYGIVDTYLKIWNVSSPSNIQLIKIIEPSSPNFDWLSDLVIQSNIAYLMSHNGGYTWAFDVMDPSNSFFLNGWASGAWRLSALGRSLYYYEEVCTHYCTVWLSGWNVSNIYEPIWLDSHWMAPVYESLYPYTMKGEGVYLYVGTDAAVFAYLPAQPAYNGQVVMAYPLAHVRDLAVSQGYLWVASEQGLIIFEDLPRQKAFLPVQLR